MKKWWLEWRSEWRSEWDRYTSDKYTQWYELATCIIMCVLLVLWVWLLAGVMLRLGTVGAPDFRLRW